MLLILLLVAVAFWYRRAYEEQINNLERAKSCARALEEYREIHHAYPARLSDVVPHAVDWWGHPLQYESNGSQFLMISFGRDGRPDQPIESYRRWRALDQPRRICGKPNADQVLTERGFLQACGK